MLTLFYYFRRRDKSLPRRKTRGQRDQQRKRSLTAQPLLPANNNNTGENSALLPLATPVSPLRAAAEADPFHEGGVLEQLSSTKAVQEAMREASAKN